MMSAHFLQKSPLALLCAVLLMGTLRVHAATEVIGFDLVGFVAVQGPGTATRTADFSGLSDIDGFGIVADWQATLADQQDGLFPWSLDMRITATSPSGTPVVWDPIGGDRTIASYPFSDYSPTFSTTQPGGTYELAFSTPGVPNPWISAVDNAVVYAMRSAADVSSEYDASVASGPEWNRPFFIEGVSGLGPVVYDAIEFTVPVSGSYSFESVLPGGGNNFTFLYQDGFDSDQPLENLLDYGLGNGSAPNGTPQGTSLIEALLLTGETYYYVTSQFDRFTPGTDFETTIIGPAAIQIVPSLPDGDFNDDAQYDCTDVDELVVQIVSNTNVADYDMTGDGLVDQLDLSAWLAEAGSVRLPSGNPYLPADINLDGNVDASDFILWNESRFTAVSAFCEGDLNADGFVDAQDFVIWNDFRFQSADAMVPEPTWGLALGLALAFQILRR